MNRDSSLQNILLICNAHLDPVWKWDWEEGLTEALSTFETAADLLDENPDLIFNHNESVLYQWVLEYRADLFERIRKHVAAGRWHIAGGWYLQPDCNMPDGESFVRQILVGREFFRRHFGVEPRLAYNFDAFGHHGNLPQILKKSGYSAYVHFRPDKKELELPADFYRWEGIDGSQVLVYRPPYAWYGTDDHKELANRVTAFADGKPVAGIFWGMGDHGGGATREDLREIAKLQKKHPGLRHSTAQSLLEDMEKHQETAPLWRGDLQRTFTGCYTSVSATKQSNRRSESLAQQAERFATLAWWFLKKPYPAARMEAIWKDTLFNQFHDILPGSSTRPAMAGTFEIAGRAMKNAREVILESQLALMARKTRRKPLTIAVFNPHPHPCRLPVDVEYMVGHRPIFTRYVTARITSENGATIPSQDEMTHAVTTRFDWRKRVVFEADLPAAGYREFTINLDTRDKPKPHKVATRIRKEWHWENSHYRIVLDGTTGLVKRLVERKSGKSVLKAPGGALGVFKDRGDAWGTGLLEYRDCLGTFQLATPAQAAELSGQGDLGKVAPVRIIEDGPVRTIWECLFVYGRSTASVRYCLYRNRPEIEAEVRVIWNQPGQQLKWIWPTRFASGEHLAEIPYGDISRAQGGGEQTHSRWLAVEDHSTGKNAGGAFGITGIGPSGHDVADGEIRITLLRSAIYAHCFLHHLRKDRFHDFMDLGESRFRFGLLVGRRNRLRAGLVKLTGRLSMPAAALVHYPLAPCPAGGVPEGQPLVSLEGDGLEVGAVKASQDGRRLVLRLVERNGRASGGVLSIRGTLNRHRMAFAPYEIKTLLIDRKGKLQECDLMERPLARKQQP